MDGEARQAWIERELAEHKAKGASDSDLMQLRKVYEKGLVEAYRRQGYTTDYWVSIAVGVRGEYPFGTT